MKRYEVNISEIAQEDLKGIFDYITDVLYAPKAAKELLEEMKKSILSLELSLIHIFWRCERGESTKNVYNRSW